MDIVGREIMRVSDVNKQQTTLNIATLEKGMYFLKIITEDGARQNKKVVKY